MNRKIVTIGIVLGLLITAYIVGQSNGSDSAIRQQMKRDFLLHKTLMALDKSVLTNMTVRASTLTSGTYVLETRFTDECSQVPLDIVFTNGEWLIKTQTTVAGYLLTSGQPFKQDGKLVLGSMFDIEKGPTREYVGLVDGNMAWGRVYQEPGHGWREGEPPAYGVWRLYPKSEK